MDVDVARKRLFISRDPRGFTSPGHARRHVPRRRACTSSTSPTRARMTQVGFFTLPAGHTIDVRQRLRLPLDRRPVRERADAAGDWVGRPIFATDVRDPANPKPCPEPIDTGAQRRRDRLRRTTCRSTARGVAWVSGAGGVRGYWTSGAHRNPVTGETATACKPVPTAVGHAGQATPSRFMHNASATRRRRRPARAPRPPRRARAAPAGARSAKPRAPAHEASLAASRRRTRAPPRSAAPAARRSAAQVAVRARARRPRRSDVLYGTEENVVSDCATSGPLRHLRPRGHARRRGLPRHRDDQAPHDGARHVDARGARRARPAARRRTTSPPRRRRLRQRVLRAGRALPRRLATRATSARSAGGARTTRTRGRRTGTTATCSSPTSSAASRSCASRGTPSLGAPADRHRAPADGPDLGYLCPLTVRRQQRGDVLQALVTALARR